jgi:hypothetical protein
MEDGKISPVRLAYYQGLTQEIGKPDYWYNLAYANYHTTRIRRWAPYSLPQKPM